MKAAARPASAARPERLAPIAGPAFGVLTTTVIVAALLWRAGRAVPSLDAAWVYAAFAGVGWVSGFLSGLLGIGGALVVVPAMVVLLPATGTLADDVQHVAVASSLAAMVPTSLAAAFAQARRGALDIPWLRRLAPGMALGAATGAMFAMSLRGTTLALLFAAQSLYYGWGLVQAAPALAESWRGRLARACGRLTPVLVAPAIAAFCACAGMGGGSLAVPWLLQQGVPLLRAVATSSALNLCIALGGALTFMVPHGRDTSDASTVCWPAALAVGLAAVCSVRRGVAMAHVLPVGAFRRLLGAVTLVGAGVLIVRAMLA